MKRLVFISTRFLFPATSGGAIRTRDILSGLKDHYHVVLLSPAPSNWMKWKDDLDAICSDFRPWKAKHRLKYHLDRLSSFTSGLPAAIACDANPQAREQVKQALRGADLLVLDFPHAAILLDQQKPPPCPTLLFTHNVEHEIYARHAQICKNPFQSLIWNSQARLMKGWEERVAKKMDGIITVSPRDEVYFKKHNDRVFAIPTAVDLERYPYAVPPKSSRHLVFIGSMNWSANLDGINWFLEQIWPQLHTRIPDASLDIIGSHPGKALTNMANRLDSVRVTGFVETIIPWLHKSALSIIPLRIGSGTRIKAIESMALGCPIVSTEIGIEGLNLTPGDHYLEASDADSFTDACARILEDSAIREKLSHNARKRAEEHHSLSAVQRSFLKACTSLT